MVGGACCTKSSFWPWNLITRGRNVRFAGGALGCVLLKRKRNAKQMGVGGCCCLLFRVRCVGSGRRGSKFCDALYFGGKFVRL